MSIFKKKQQPERPPEKPKRFKIHLSEDEFLSMVVDFESGKLPVSDVIILFSYISERELFERYLYPWLKEMIDFGVIDEGLVNYQKLLNYFKN